MTFQDYLRYEMPLRENVAMGAIEQRDDDAGIEAEVRRVGLGDAARRPAARPGHAR